MNRCFFAAYYREAFLGFAALMTGPWLVISAVEFLTFRWFFATDLIGSAEPAGPSSTPAPRFALTVIALTLTLTGFAASSFTPIPPIPPIPPVVVASVGAALTCEDATEGRQRPRIVHRAGFRCLGGALR